MASVLKYASLAAISLCLAGAASAQSVGSQVDAGGLKFEALDAQELKPGQCALFVWSRSARPVFILFAPDNPSRATARVDGREQQFERKATSGARVLGHFERQTFAGGRYAFEIELAYDTDHPIQDGALIRQGVLRHRDSKGNLTVVPVGGMIGCKKAKQR